MTALNAVTSRCIYSFRSACSDIFAGYCTADRKARQQAAAQASLMGQRQQPVTNGTRRTTVDAGGTRRVHKQMEEMDAAPQKRQRRVSQKMQEALDDPDAELGATFALDCGARLM